MGDTPGFETTRLRLRKWRDSDLLPFSVMNADPSVIEYLPHALSRDESDAFAGRIGAHFAERGFGLWAVEVLGIAEFIGFIGLSVPASIMPFTPCVEVGWRIAAQHWGHGYATEGARAALAFGFEQLGLDEIVSFTVPANRRSRRVMEKLGLRRDAHGDFDHPRFPDGHVLQRHMLYRLSRAAWRGSQADSLSVWKLRGYDAFSAEAYPIAGDYGSEAEAILAAERVLADLERQQPSQSSGGQQGIQDQVFIVRPNGTAFLYEKPA